MIRFSTTPASGTDRSTRRSRRVWYGVIAGCLVAGLCCSGSVLAGSGATVHRPRGNRVPKSGLQMKVDLHWVTGAGYRPVRIEVTSVTGPVTADRSLRVEFSPNNWTGNDGQLYVAKYLEIPEGSSGVEETISVPQHLPWRTFSLRVYEDGAEIEELKVEGESIDNVSEWSEAVPKALFIHNAAPTPDERETMLRRYKLGRYSAQAIKDLPKWPDLRSWRDVTQADTARFVPPYGRLSAIERLELVDETPTFEFLPPQYLTANWIDLTTFDLIFVSLDDLQSMKKQHPAQFDALRTAVGAGGNLCLWGVGGDFTRLDEVEQLLELSPVQGRAGDDPFRGWTVPDPRQHGWTDSTLREIMSNQGYALGGELVEREDQSWRYLPDGSRVPRDPASVPNMAEPPFLVRKLDLGTVAAIASDNPFPGHTAYWYWLLSTLTDDNWQSYRRLGMSLQRHNDEYWTLMIPGVGAAPVTAFRVLITMFVIVIGPLNYWWLSRWRRLHLLLVTVPAGAFLVTATLFLYAVLSDGLGVRARLRSFTYLDQTRGRCVSWSRQTYYAGLAPSEGLVFPRGSAVYPLFQQPYRDEERGTHERHIEWGDEQHLSRGWLRARTVTQMLVLHADQTRMGLQIKPSGGDEAPLEITNDLDGRIVKLVLRDENDRYFKAEDVAEGAVFRPAPSSRAVARATLRSTYDANRLDVPRDFDSYGYGDSGRYGYRYYGYYGMDRGLSDPTVRSSILERNLMAAASSEEDLDTRSYIAVVERTSAVPMGTEAEEEASYHVIRGKF